MYVLDQSPCKFLPFVFLYKVPSTPNLRVVLPLSAWNFALPSHLAAFGHWVSGAEQSDKRFVPSLEKRPSALVGGSGAVIWVDGAQRGEASGTHFVPAVGVGRIVSSNF